MLHNVQGRNESGVVQCSTERKIRLLCVMHVVWTSEYVLFIEYVCLRDALGRVSFRRGCRIADVHSVRALCTLLRRIVSIGKASCGAQVARERIRRDSRTRPANSTRIESLDAAVDGHSRHSTRTPPLAWVQRYRVRAVQRPTRSANRLLDHAAAPRPTRLSHSGAAAGSRYRPRP